MAGKYVTTTKDVGLLRQLYEAGQLSISPEFQRNAVWSRPAKAYLIDTILAGIPIPVLYFQRSVSAQTSRVEYAVVDGQQRLNAVFLFMENRFSLTESPEDAPWHRKRWKTLSSDERERILSYDFVVQELSGYDPRRIRDMFQRMNRYVVALNPQELRHASHEGAFKILVEAIGSWPFWVDQGIVTRQAKDRMRADELVAELLILLNEGPQDKKESVDLYYNSFRESFEAGPALQGELKAILDAIGTAIPNLRQYPLLKRPVNLYALVGALSELRAEDEPLPKPDLMRERLDAFNLGLNASEDARRPEHTRYIIAQSRQTDNVKPRRTRIDILKNVILGKV
ncbi:DUF262 domain-containing protein [Mumia sp. Pv 4-285]|uniref:DUF262 domain-containing protein n=1 Tax=Mumia qirimensis TaxID=3234852 RepID=UPI00351D180F